MKLIISIFFRAGLTGDRVGQMKLSEIELTQAESRGTEVFDLQSFFPYQTRIFYRAITSAVEAVYRESYGLKPYEWRTMAILGQSQKLTPADIVERSSMDKVSVSRAVTSLLKRKWIVESANRIDSRSKFLRLSAAGKRVYLHLIPKMNLVEQEILSPLDPQEVQTLLELMARVRTGLAKQKPIM